MSTELQTNPEFPTELPYVKVGDLGFVALVDVMGTDASMMGSDAGPVQSPTHWSGPPPLSLFEIRLQGTATASQGACIKFCK